MPRLCFGLRGRGVRRFSDRQLQAITGISRGALTVSSVFVLRRHPEIARPFRTPGYPVTPAVFLLLMAWMVVHAVIERPVVAAAGLATVGLGVVVYLIGGRSRPAAAPYKR